MLIQFLLWTHIVLGSGPFLSQNTPTSYHTVLPYEVNIFLPLRLFVLPCSTRKSDHRKIAVTYPFFFFRVNIPITLTVLHLRRALLFLLLSPLRHISNLSVSLKIDSYLKVNVILLKEVVCNREHQDSVLFCETVHSVQSEITFVLQQPCHVQDNPELLLD